MNETPKQSPETTPSTAEQDRESLAWECQAEGPNNYSEVEFEANYTVKCKQTFYGIAGKLHAEHPIFGEKGIRVNQMSELISRKNNYHGREEQLQEGEVIGIPGYKSFLDLEKGVEFASMTESIREQETQD